MGAVDIPFIIISPSILHRSTVIPAHSSFSSGHSAKYVIRVHDYFSSIFSFPLLLPPSPTPPHSPIRPSSLPPLPPPQLMQFCDLCYVDAQTSGFVGLGTNAFLGLCVHYFCVPFCVCWYEPSLKSNKPFESWVLSLWVTQQMLPITDSCLGHLHWNINIYVCDSQSPMFRVIRKETEKAALNKMQGE